MKNAQKYALFKMAHGGHIGTGLVCNLITKCSRTMFKLCKITNFRMGNSVMTLIFNFELTLTLKSKMASGCHLGIGRFCNLKTTHGRTMCELCKITNFRMGNSLKILYLCSELTLTFYCLGGYALSSFSGE